MAATLASVLHNGEQDAIIVAGRIRWLGNPGLVSPSFLAQVTAHSRRIHRPSSSVGRFAQMLISEQVVAHALAGPSSQGVLRLINFR